ncbi:MULTISPECIES: hypothetical protein [Salinibaculum]|uniref:hypothetical protein n=1 Tax=Salinibaculum TaxID=2732368 RepID=UPI0030CD308A
MSTAGRPETDAPAASDVATRLREADFVRLVAAADGDALAAVGLVARALDSDATPYQATVAPVPDDAVRETDADLTVALGRPLPTADLTLGTDTSASRVGYDVAAQFGDPDPVLALAGVAAGGGVPSGRPLEDAEATGLGRRPGVAVPTTDLVDGLAHSTLAHGPFSGDEESAAALVDDLDLPDDPDDATHRRVASLVALAIAGDADATPRGAEAVERFLRPYAGAPFETVGGYADVLDAVARTDPGLGVALAVGSVDRDAALAAWRDHGERAHAAVDGATTGRYDGLFVARCEGDAPVGTVARLVRDFRSPEPVVLVVADGEAAALADDGTNAGAVVAEAARAVGGDGDGTDDWGRARFDGDDAEFVLAFREAQ